MGKFKRLYEFTEFAALGLAQGSPMPMSVNDPQLTFNAHDRFAHGVQAATQRLNGILGRVVPSSVHSDFRAATMLDEQMPTKLSIVRLETPDNVRWVARLSIDIGDKNYFGKVDDLFGNRRFVCQAFSDKNLVQNKTWQVRFESVILESLDKWFDIPADSEHIALKELTCRNTVTGKVYKIPMGAKIKVDYVEDRKIYLVDAMSGNKYVMSGEHYVYFNYWTQQV